MTFVCDLAKGQKTGAFLDQRENHQAARRYASGEVLDCFSYHGGFALTIAGKCAHVQGIDMASSAVEAARRNKELNSISNVDFREGNTFDLLKEYDEMRRRFQMVILDPPAFAKNRESIPAARRGYKEINLRALKLLELGGYLDYVLLLLPHQRAALLADPGRSRERRAQEYRGSRASDASPGSPHHADHAGNALSQVPDS